MANLGRPRRFRDAQGHATRGAAMRRFAFCCVCLGLLAGIAATGPARADGIGDALDDIGASEQAQNAADALQEGLTTWVSRGRATRGAEGILGELAVNSGELACQSAIARAPGSAVWLWCWVMS